MMSSVMIIILTIAFIYLILRNNNKVVSGIFFVVSMLSTLYLGNSMQGVSFIMIGLGLIVFVFNYLN